MQEGAFFHPFFFLFFFFFPLLVIWGKKNLRSEETGQQVADDTTNSVLGKDIEAIVNADPELELGGQVAHNTANNTEDDRRPSGNVAGRWRNSNQALWEHKSALIHQSETLATNHGDRRTRWGATKTYSNSTTAETNSRPFLLETVVQQAPGESTTASGNVCHNAGHDSA